jgi:phosphoribosylanthranilate isomerase
MVWVKICGITSPADAVAGADAGADAIGMLFAPSTRRVSIETGRQIARALPPHVERVGLFYDESAAIIEETAEAVGLTAVQLHGDESPDFVAALFRANGRRSRVRVFKTIHISADAPPDVGSYLRRNIVDAFLLDTVAQDPATGAVSRGGTGRAFDWSRTGRLPNSSRRART